MCWPDVSVQFPVKGKPIDCMHRKQEEREQLRVMVAFSGLL